MPRFEYISKRGEHLDLIGNNYFTLIDLEGQTSVATSLSSVVLGGFDGSIVTNAQANPRTIVLNLYLNTDKNVEEAKRQILKVVKIKQQGTIVWEQNERVVAINGIVENIDMPRWLKGVIMQISLFCESPYWEDIKNAEQEIKDYIDLHYFTTDNADMLFFPTEGIPFGAYDMERTKTFTNAGDVAVGIEITINAIETVTNPIIYDTYGNFFGVGYGNGNKKVVMQRGDVIKITTHKGNKTVKMNGQNILDKVMPKSTWLQIDTGDNQFRIDSEEENGENMTFNLTYKQRYV